MSDLSRSARWMLVGAIAFALVGAVVGLVLGLAAHPSTAWFAVIEVGLPAAVLGGILGLVAAGAAWSIEHVRAPGAR